MGLTITEQRSHFSLWALVASPLLIGTDLSQISPDALAILKAPEVIAVSQDALGKQGTRVSASNSSGVECWAKPLHDGRCDSALGLTAPVTARARTSASGSPSFVPLCSVAAILLNRGSTSATATCSWSEVGLKPGTKAVGRLRWCGATLRFDCRRRRRSPIFLSGLWRQRVLQFHFTFVASYSFASA